MIDKDFKNIPQAFFHFAGANPEAIAFEQQLEGTAGSDQSRMLFSELRCHVARVANLLQSLSVGLGSKVAIVSNSRPEWLISDLAILCCAATSVSVYQSLPATEIGYILYDSGADVVFAENQEQVEKLLWLNRNPCPIPATEDRPACSVQLKIRTIISFEPTDPQSLVYSWHKILSDHPAEFDQNQLANLQGNDIASIVYSSGTTGPAKGVMQTHLNHLANVRQAKNAGMFEETSTIFLVLPLAHSFAKLMGYIGSLCGVTIKFAQVSNRHNSQVDPRIVARCMRNANAKLIPIVPRLLEKIKEGIEQKARAKSIIGRLVRLTVWSAKTRFNALKAGQELPVSVRVAFQLTSRIRAKLCSEIFGNCFENVISGGAKLPVVVAEFFEALGIEILEGYGLTETCVATNVNRHGAKKIGSVGPVLDTDIEMKSADDGEILFRGPNITKSYFNRPTATQQAWDSEGWFHTGDLGSIDSDGYLTITGRKKELIVTSGGKKIGPDRIEQELKRSSFVSQVVICGDGRQYCVALVLPNFEAVQNWAKKNQYNLAANLADDQAVLQLIQQEIQAVNTQLASFETIKRFHLLHEDFTIENGLLTPTMKIKRQAVYSRYKHEIDAMYAGAAVKD